MNLINPNFQIEHLKTPYDIWILDNFLQTDILEQIKKEWPDINSDKWHKGHEYIDGKKNILEQGMRSISKLDEVPTFTSKVLKYIHTKEFTKVLSDIVKMTGLIPDESFRWSGPRVMVPGSFQAIHSDARKNHSGDWYNTNSRHRT